MLSLSRSSWRSLRHRPNDTHMFFPAHLNHHAIRAFPSVRLAARHHSQHAVPTRRPLVHTYTPTPHNTTTYMPPAALIAHPVRVLGGGPCRFLSSSSVPSGSSEQSDTDRKMKMKKKKKKKERKRRSSDRDILRESPMERRRRERREKRQELARQSSNLEATQTSSSKPSPFASADSSSSSAEASAAGPSGDVPPGTTPRRRRRASRMNVTSTVSVLGLLKQKKGAASGDDDSATAAGDGATQQGSAQPGAPPAGIASLFSEVRKRRKDFEQEKHLLRQQQQAVAPDATLDEEFIDNILFDSTPHDDPLTSDYVTMDELSDSPLGGAYDADDVVEPPSVPVNAQVQDVLVQDVAPPPFLQGQQVDAVPEFLRPPDQQRQHGHGNAREEQFDSMMADRLSVLDGKEADDASDPFNTAMGSVWGDASSQLLTSNMAVPLRSSVDVRIQESEPYERGRNFHPLLATARFRQQNEEAAARKVAKQAEDIAVLRNAQSKVQEAEDAAREAKRQEMQAEQGIKERLTGTVTGGRQQGVAVDAADDVMAATKALDDHKPWVLDLRGGPKEQRSTEHTQFMKNLGDPNAEVTLGGLDAEDTKDWVSEDFDFANAADGKKERDADTELVRAMLTKPREKELSHPLEHLQGRTFVLIDETDMTLLSLAAENGIDINLLKQAWEVVYPDIELKSTRDLVPVKKLGKMLWEVGAEPRYINAFSTKNCLFWFQKGSWDEMYMEDAMAHPERYINRRPVVCVMGHVDHGKTTLVDFLRNSRLVDKEAGGITQSIAAFTVDIKPTWADDEVPFERDLGAVGFEPQDEAVFVDTPGHAAFRKMRELGSQVTDIVIVVIDVKEGVKPQTAEAIDLAIKNKCELVIAVNKMDKDFADPLPVYEQLLDFDVEAEPLGGLVPCAEISAKTGFGMESLRRAIVKVSDQKFILAPKDGSAECAVIERHMTPSGPALSVIVISGQMKLGDVAVCGMVYGSIRALIDDKGNVRKTAGPGDSVMVFGVPEGDEAGSDLLIVDSQDMAESEIRVRKQRRDMVIQSRQRAEAAKESKSSNLTTLEKWEKRAEYLLSVADRNGLGSVHSVHLERKLAKLRNQALDYVNRLRADGVNFSDQYLSSFRRLNLVSGVEYEHNSSHIAEVEDEVRTWSVLIRADTQGTIDSMMDYINQLPTDEVRTRIADVSIGELTKDDVMKAQKMGLTIVCFAAKIKKSVTKLIEQRKVPIFKVNLIHEFFDVVRDELSRYLPPVTEFFVTGTARCKAVFAHNRKDRANATVAGCEMRTGVLKHGDLARVIRNRVIVFESKIHELRHVKDIITNTAEYHEFGVALEDPWQFEVGDIIETYEARDEYRKLDDLEARGVKLETPKSVAQRREIMTPT